jgi:hypothetical protein
MTETKTDAFLEYVSARAGDALRAVMLFRDGDYRHLYLRSDVGEAYDSSQYDDIAALFVEEHDHVLRAESTFDAGRMESMTYVLDDAIVLVFPTNGRQGAAISLDRSAGSNLFQFVREARTRLYGQEDD